MPLPSAPNGPDHLWRSLTGLPSPTPRLARESLAGKRILLTGAGGSIGSALARTLAASRPSHLLLLDSSEHSLYQVDRDLAALPHSDVPHTAVLGSVTDRPLLDDLFFRHRPDIVFHAAAFKHVPLVEQNPFAALANNALGTYTLAQAAAHSKAHPQHLVLVSTDKAVDPRSLMGASKRIAEFVLLTLAHSSPTQMSVVRLGNVLGSHGSVLPLFLDQIAHGGPLTVTHPEARRYFLTLEQTVAALLDALETAPARPNFNSGIILVPQLAPPLRILDLAHHLLHQHASNAEIVFPGLRPGDKLEESLLSGRERWLPSPHPNLRAVSSPHPAAAALSAALYALDKALHRRDLAAALAIVLQLVPEYTPSPQLAAALHPVQEARA